MPALFQVVTQPNRIEPPTHAWRAALWRVSAPTNSQEVELVAAPPVVTLPYRLFLDSKALVAAFRTWYASVKGALTAFWLPSYQMDLALTADVASSDTTLTITSPAGAADAARASYAARFFPYECRRHLAFITADGTVTHRRVESVALNGDGTETLTLDAAVGVAVSATYDLVSFLLLVRLAADPVTIPWRTPAFAEPVVEVVELPHEYPTTVS